MGFIETFKLKGC